MILTSADDFSVEIYGTIAPATKEACNALPFPVKYFDTKFGWKVHPATSTWLSILFCAAIFACLASCMSF